MFVLPLGSEEPNQMVLQLPFRHSVDVSYCVHLGVFDNDVCCVFPYGPVHGNDDIVFS